MLVVDRQENRQLIRPELGTIEVGIAVLRV